MGPAGWEEAAGDEREVQGVTNTLIPVLFPRQLSSEKHSLFQAPPFIFILVTQPGGFLPPCLLPCRAGAVLLLPGLPLGACPLASQGQQHRGARPFAATSPGYKASPRPLTPASHRTAACEDAAGALASLGAEGSGRWDIREG